MAAGRIATRSRFSNSGVLVWNYFLPDISLSGAAALLSDEEHGKAAACSHEKTRESFVKARGMARIVLGAIARESPAELSIGYRWGKPYLPHNPRICFSISRSEECLAIAVADSSIGVDVEKTKANPGGDQLAGCFFHAREKETLRRLPPAARRDAFLRIWTQKEAVTKALGKGLHFPLERFAVSAEGGGVFFEPDVRPPQDWYSVILETIPGYRLALATRKPCAPVRIFNTEPQSGSHRARLLGRA